MNMKENIFWEMNEQLLVRLTKLIELGKWIHLYNETQGNKEYKHFQQKIVFIGCKKIKKEEGI